MNSTQLDNTRENMPDLRVKKSYYTLPYTEFILSPDNLRRDIDAHIKDTQLLEWIKRDGGVREYCYALPAKFNIDGKKVLDEGSSRLRCLQLLANDPDYQGSLQLPYVVIPEDIINDPVKRVKFRLSANAIDKRISPQEQWNGIKTLIDFYEPQCKKRSKAAERVAEELGFSCNWINRLRNVFENASHPSIIRALAEGVITSVEAAANLQTASKMHDINIDTLLGECLDVARERGKARVTDPILERAIKNLTIYIPDLLMESAENENEIDKTVEVLENSGNNQDKKSDNFVEHSAENIDQQVEKDTNNFQQVEDSNDDLKNDTEDTEQLEDSEDAETVTEEIENSEDDGETKTIIINRETSLEKIKFFRDFINQLLTDDQLEELKLIDDKNLIVTANKLDGIYIKLNSVMDKAKKVEALGF